MSTIKLSNTNNFRKPSSCFKQSDELDVFDAARYFSGSIDCVSNALREDKLMRKPAKKSLERATTSTPAAVNTAQASKKEITKDEPYKQPSSPCGSLADFLSLLFQSSLKKKLRYLEDGEKILELRDKSNVNSKAKVTSHEAWQDNKVAMINDDHTWMAEKARFRERFFKNYKFASNGAVENKWVLKGNSAWKDKVWANEMKAKERRGFKRVVLEEEDGGESDSSSDLFEIKSFCSGTLSSDLPVYGTTDMEFVKREAIAIAISIGSSARSARNGKDPNTYNNN
ncbi:uncharacterized protein LOC120250378 isoform X2 [Dioscorea cayenensis subsp. rotundata]|uniref:Uncharacterized protein LOC120250378 isoform X2 n=1 Tax=Dioscorea cayennensis subsp. rotundata TaxID=55577 RepID=A0AB40AJW8_DIOCR|nr:uncharacterized protein LOC120250378 isoform X2 [Dioscorea cayenensis subsp. rotundata]